MSVISHEEAKIGETRLIQLVLLALCALCMQASKAIMRQIIADFGVLNG